MPPKENPERACEECIHFFACSRQCGEPMAQSSATGCECYETIKSSMAYYVGTLDGAKGKIPNRLRELAEADEDGRVVVLPCKAGDMIYEVTGRKTISVYKVKAIRVELFSLFIEWDIVEGFVWRYLNGINANEIGKTVFLTREEAEKALQGMESENGIENSKSYPEKDEPDGTLRQ